MTVTVMRAGRVGDHRAAVAPTTPPTTAPPTEFDTTPLISAPFSVWLSQ